jgi:hypothetical protein
VNEQGQGIINLRVLHHGLHEAWFQLDPPCSPALNDLGETIDDIVLTAICSKGISRSAACF